MRDLSWNAPFAGLTLLLITPATMAGPCPNASPELGPTAGFAQLSSSPFCRASYPTRDGGKLCLSAELWAQWLRGSAADLSQDHWDARPKTTATLSNLPHEFKQVRLRWVARQLPDSSSTPWTWRLIRKVERLRERVSRQLSGHSLDRLGLLRKLLLNESHSGDAQELLRTLGWVHLFTATGIHLYALAAIWDQILRRGFALIGVPVRFGLGIRRVLVAGTWLSAWLLAGARPGMLRPWIVVGLRSAAGFLGFRWRSFAPLAVALLVDLGIASLRSALGEPGAWAPGRWLYALAVGGGLWFGEAHRSSHLLLAVGSWILAAVWEVVDHGLVAPWTPLLSLISIPIYATVVYPVALGGALLGWSSCLQTLASLSDGALELSLLALFRSAPLWSLSGSSLGIGLCLAAILSVLMGFRESWKLPRRIALWVALTFLFGAAHAGYTLLRPIPLTKPKTPLAQVDQLDVGQGDSALVRTAFGAGLIDTGTREALTFTRWIKIFSEARISSLDWIALTHLDADHAGAANLLSSLLPVSCVVTTRGEWHSPRGRQLRVELARRGIRTVNWGEDCLPFPALPPPRQQERTTLRNANMGSLWIPLSSGGAYLSAGDATHRDEPRIGRWFVQSRKEHGIQGPTWMKISHHGSKTSTSREFLELVRPKEAWISVGCGNRYGHPTLPVLERLESLKIPVRRTDLEGRLSIKEEVAHHPR